MKRLSICLPALALALVLLLSGTAPKSLSAASASVKSTISPAHPASTNKAAKKMYMYYWYVVPGDYYNDYADLADEIWEWETIYGLWVDTNPMGGTPIACGYMTNNYPHVAYPSAYLYVHYPQ